MKVVLFSWKIIIQLSWPENWIVQEQLEAHVNKGIYYNEDFLQ
jgi:hypothetical protein